MRPRSRLNCLERVLARTTPLLFIGTMMFAVSAVFLLAVSNMSSSSDFSPRGSGHTNDFMQKQLETLRQRVIDVSSYFNISICIFSENLVSFLPMGKNKIFFYVLDPCDCDVLVTLTTPF